MQTDFLAKAYAAKTDEELLQLAGQANDLTPEACTALRSEMARRRLEGPDPAVDDVAPGLIRQGRGAFTVKITGVAEFVAEAIGVYHRQFWLFFSLVAPAVAIGWFAVVMGRNESREIAQNIPSGEAGWHPVELTEVMIANFAGLLGSWTAFSFSFAGICVAVQRLAAGSRPSIGECFLPVRNRLVRFLQLSSLVFAVLLFLEIAVGIFLAFGMFWALPQLHIRITGLAVRLVSYSCFGMVLVVMSRFALAIPALILDDCRVGQSMFRSDEYTEGKWLVLAALVAKSVIGGYVAAMAPFWIAPLVLDHMPVPWWFDWVPIAASIAATSVVEPTMFIGFTLLYLQRSNNSSTSGIAHSVT